MSDSFELDNDWGDDPFEGDMDFDMDFDNPGGNKGFFRSAVTGFLNGIVDRTVGSTDAQIDTLKRVLPNTWTPAFRNLREMNDRRKQVMEEMKNNSYQAVQDLQYLAERAAKASAGKVPNKISEGLLGFSQRDFSSWEDRSGMGDDDTVRMEDVQEGDVQAILQNEDANSMLDRQTMESVGARTIRALNEVGGRTIGGMHAITQTTMRTNQLLEHLLDYQRRVKQRHDNMQLNVLARHYLTSAKYYKFMEASNHRIVSELKAISKATQMSDYEKTSHSDALKRSVRESVFNTVKSKFGGISEFLEEKLGQDARENATGGAADILSNIRMVAEMTEGMPLNFGSMAGNAAAGIFLNNLPKLIQMRKGQEYLAKFKKQFPKLSKWAEDAYIRLEDLGNVSSYVTGNYKELANTLSKHYQGGYMFEEHDDYDDYLASVPKGKDPVTKAQWYIMRTAKRQINKGAGAILDNVWQPDGTKYSLTQRTLADGHERQIWTRRSDRTLNEEIPRWFGLLHQSLEKIRTGNDNLRPLTYDYVQANFVTAKQRDAIALNRVLDRNQLQSQAQMANSMADSLDEQGMLSKKAKQALAYQLARDADRDLGFNPYNYFKLDEEEGMDKKTAEEIRKVMRGTFGIGDDDLKAFFEGSEADRLKKATYMPTEAGRKKLTGMADSARLLADFVPDIAERLDILKGNGYYEALKKSGVITTSAHGTEEVNDELVWKMLKEFIKNPERKTAIVPEDDAIDPTRPYTTQRTTTIKTGRGKKEKEETIQIPSNVIKLEGLDQLMGSLDGLKDLNKSLSQASEGFKSIGTLGDKIDLTPVSSRMDQLITQVTSLVALNTTSSETLTKIHEGLPRRRRPLSDTEQNEIQQGKRTIMDRIKQFSFKDMFNKGVEKLLDNEPLILGGLLGGLAGVAFHDPKAAALIGGGMAAAAVYSKIRTMAKARTPEDDQDLYEEGSEEPILEAKRLQAGQYYDLAKSKLIKSWKDISGSIKIVSTDAYNGTIIGARRLANKLFTAENKEVFLSGLNKLRELLLKGFRFLDPMGRASKLKNAISKRFFQMDVYKEGADAPTLLGKSFDGGAYWKKDKDGKPVVLKGWNEIDGPVYDREGNVLITQEEYDRGLVTSMGVSINKMGALTRKASAWTWDIAKKFGNKAAEYAGVAKDKAMDTFKADYSPIVNSVDRIYHLLREHWGYKDERPAVEIDPEGPVAAPAAEEPATQPETKPAKEAAPKKAPRKRKAKPKADDPTAPSAEEVARREEADLKPEGGDKYTLANGIRKKVKAMGAEKAEETARLNSAADQKTKKEKKKKEKVQDAIIDIASGMGFGDKENKDKPKGLFGLLASGIGGIFSVVSGISAFFTKRLWGSFKLLGTFASIGIKALPMMVTGIAAVAKGIMTLVQTRSITQAGGEVLDTVLNRDPAERQERRNRRGQKKSFGGSLKSGGLALGVGLVADQAMNGLIDSGLVSEDGLAANAADVVSTAATVYGGYQLAAGVAGLMGTTVTGAAITAGGALWGGAVAAGGFLAPLLFNPFTLGAIAVGLAGYGLYKFFQAGKGTQLKIRLTQYGVSDVESELAEKVLKAEQLLQEFVVIGNGRASISKSAPIEEVFKLFITDPKDKKQLGDVFTWFNGRFKPVFLTYHACLDVVKMKTLKQYDEAQGQDVYKVAKQAHAALVTVMPYPYSIVAKIDADTPLMGERDTVIRVNNFMEELKKYSDRKTDSDELAPVATPKSEKALIEEKKTLEKKLEDKSNFASGWDGVKQRNEAHARVKQINSQLQGLNSEFKLSPMVKQIWIKDLLPDDRAMDLLTAIRVACYGNDEDIPWRVEAVLRLERHCESLFKFDGQEVKFTGQVGDLYGLFKESFRLDKNDNGDNWCRWFRDRFAPVMSTYVQMVANYRKGNPGLVWKSLSTTARYEIAKALIETKVTITKAFIVPVWNVRAAPFDGASSPSKPDKVTRMLKLLSEAATQAKLRDPEKEAGKTNTQTWANTISPHKTGGGWTPNAANVQKPQDYKNRRDVAMGGQFGTSTSRGAGNGNIYDMSGAYNTPSNSFGFKPLTGDSDTSHLDMTGVERNQGKDTGIKVPRKLAEQLIIREMLKQGFTDPRAIAEMLALTNYETGGYTRTVENMKYTDPQRLMRMFKEVTNLEQAKQLVAAGEVAIANTVYGGGKGQSLGNSKPGDGFLYRGRGLVQLTGRANYARIGQELGIDLEGKPELASEDPNVMAAIAVNFYKNSKLLRSITEDGNFGRAATGLNGGNALPGMGDRYRLYLQYLDQLQKGSLQANEDGATAASQDKVGGEAPSSSGGGSVYGTPGAGSSPAGGEGGASTPMIGNGATPPLGASPSGGLASGGNFGTPGTSSRAEGDYSGAMSGNGGADTPLVNSGVSGSSGLRLKSPEAVAGGPAHPGVMALGRMIQSRVQNFRYFSALNDAWHKRNKPNSKHALGLAIDFTLTNGAASSDRAHATVVGILRSAGMSPNEFKVLDEYRKASAKATGGHIHVHFMSAQAAAKFNEAAGGSATNGQDTTEGSGGPVQPTAPQADPIATPPVTPIEQTTPRGMEDDLADGQQAGSAGMPPGKTYTKVPLPGSTGGNTTTDPAGPTAPNTRKTIGQANENIDNVPSQRPPTPKAAPKAEPQAPQQAAGPSIEEIMSRLETALATSGDKQAGVMAEAVKQLIELNKNSKTPSKTVTV